MNKKMSQGVVVGTLALFLALMVGYALFSQNLNITGTATAKGKLEITPICTLGRTAEVVNEYKKFKPTDAEDESNGYDSNSESCTVQGDTVEFNTKLLYEGASRNYIVELKNTGTIDAKVSTSDFGEPAEKSGCTDKNKNGTFEEDECRSDLEIMHFTSEFFGIKKADGTIISFFELDSDAMKEFLEFNADGDAEYINLPVGASILLLNDVEFITDSRSGVQAGDFDTTNFNVLGKVKYKYNFNQKN